MLKKTIAVIGCGAAGVTFLQSFVRDCINKKFALNLKIFEPAEDLGVGLAYQKDLPNLLINRPLQTMSARIDKTDDFYLWLKNKGYLNGEQHTTEPLFSSREIFGNYLTDTLEKTLLKALRHNIQIEIIKDSVNRIEKNADAYSLKTNMNKYRADYIVLCVGNNQTRDIYQLKDTPQYINSPYPLNKTLQPIAKDSAVGIIGNSLTAIDIAISLSVTGHLGKVSLFSRSHVYPKIRKELSKAHQLKHLTLPAIEKILAKRDNITLRDALRLFRRDLKEHGFDWKSLFLEDDHEVNFAQYLHNQLITKDKISKLQSMLSATNQIVEFLWNVLDEHSRQIFIRHYQRCWLSYRTPIPKQNAELLLRMFLSDQLSVISGIKTAKYDNDKHKYQVETASSVDEFDWVINATGPSTYIQPQDKLLYQLVNEGLAQENIYGGLEVDFATAALINNNQEIDLNIRLIGQNTLGVYHYTSSLEMLARRSEIVSNDLLIWMDKNSYDQNSLAITTSADSIGYIA